METSHTEQPPAGLPRGVLDAAPRAAADGRGRLEVMTEHEVLAAVARESLGRIGFVVDGWPVVLPVNFVLDGHDVVFRSDPGAKLDASRGGRACFQVDRAECLYERGWSALALGTADRIDDPAEIDRLQRLGLRPWAGGAKANWVRITVHQWSGRRLPRAWRYPMPTR
jgi:uncharacterized protein